MNNDRGLFIRKAGVWSAVVLLALGVAGCGGSSSSSSSNSGPTGVSLTDEEQVALAAFSGGAQVGAAQGMVESQQEPQEDPAGGGGSGLSGAVALSAPGDEVALLYNCPSDEMNGTFSGEGSFHYDTDTILEIGDGAFPDSVFSHAGALPDGQSGDSQAANYINNMHMRGKCVVILNQDGSRLLDFEGALDIAQLENVFDTEGRVMWGHMGGYEGNKKGDAPDLERMVLTRTENAQMDMKFAIDFRGEFYSCDGCVKGDLNSFNGDVGLDTAFSGFMEIDLDMPGEAFNYRVGTGTDDHFTLQTAHIGGNEVEVEMAGLLAFDDSIGCGADVTYETVVPLKIQNYHLGGTDTVDGTLNITLNDTGNIYTVSFGTGNDVTILDDQGNDVTPDAEQLENKCGFDPAPDPQGTWASECIQTGASEWFKTQMVFDSHELEVIVEEFDHGSCGTPVASDSYVQTFVIGGAENMESDPVAWELNLETTTPPSGALIDPAPPQFMYGLIGIDESADMLYREDSAPQSDPEDRPHMLDMNRPFFRQ